MVMSHDFSEETRSTHLIAKQLYEQIVALHFEAHRCANASPSKGKISITCMVSHDSSDESWHYISSGPATVNRISHLREAHAWECAAPIKALSPLTDADKQLAPVSTWSPQEQQMVVSFMKRNAEMASFFAQV